MIFEDSDKSFRGLQTGLKKSSPEDGGKDLNTFIFLWLVSMFGLVFLMIVVGGLTRLTDSGLSIVEWKPLLGAIPPITVADWIIEFKKYQITDEYKYVNFNMTLDDFKFIYWWEWGHRQLGRVIGIVWAIGFLWLLFFKSISNGWLMRFALLGLLGGLQGFLGWWMVSSGLEETMLDVASYRLAIHLGMAFLILGLITWFLLKIKLRKQDLILARRARDYSMARMSTFLVVVLFIQILLGALVAGIDAGRSFNDWPLMAGLLFPPDAFSYKPFIRNIFENSGLVQFNHRILGYLVFFLAIFAWLRSRNKSREFLRKKSNQMLTVMLLQIGLGIVTVLYSAPLKIAIFHQILAVILFVVTLRFRFELLYPTYEKIKS